MNTLLLALLACGIENRLAAPAEAHESAPTCDCGGIVLLAGESSWVTDSTALVNLAEESFHVPPGAEYLVVDAALSARAVGFSESFRYRIEIGPPDGLVAIVDDRLNVSCGGGSTLRREPIPVHAVVPVPESAAGREWTIRVSGWARACAEEYSAEIRLDRLSIEGMAQAAG